MKILVFDTETTGLPDGYNVPYQQSSRWPHIVQFSFILYDLEKNKIISESDFIIDVPDDVTISEKSIEIHGITKKISRNQGFDIYLAFVIQREDCKKFRIAEDIDPKYKKLLTFALKNKLKVICYDCKFLSKGIVINNKINFIK